VPVIDAVVYDEADVALLDNLVMQDTKKGYAYISALPLPLTASKITSRAKILPREVFTVKKSSQERSQR
jgi:hypothetical protein